MIDLRALCLLAVAQQCVRPLPDWRDGPIDWTCKVDYADTVYGVQIHDQITQGGTCSVKQFRQGIRDELKRQLQFRHPKPLPAGKTNPLFDSHRV